MNYSIFKLDSKKSTDMCVVKLKARREQVRGKIPDMTGRKRGRSARKTLFRAELMDFLFFHADQQKMIFRHKGRTETFRGSTEFYGAVRRGTEKSDISFLLPLQFLFPLLRLQITPSVYLRNPPYISVISQ